MTNNIIDNNRIIYLSFYSPETRYKKLDFY